MQPLVGHRACVGLADEGERAVQVGVPCHGPDRKKRDGDERRAGGEQGLHGRWRGVSACQRTLFRPTSTVLEDADRVEASRACSRQNIQTSPFGPALDSKPTDETRVLSALDEERGAPRASWLLRMLKDISVVESRPWRRWQGEQG